MNIHCKNQWFLERSMKPAKADRQSHYLALYFDCAKKSKNHTRISIFAINIIQYTEKFCLCLIFALLFEVEFKIDVFPIIFDARGLRPDMLRFPCVCVMTFMLRLWRHRINTWIHTEKRGKRSMSGLSPLASNIIGKTSLGAVELYTCTKDYATNLERGGIQDKKNQSHIPIGWIQSCLQYYIHLLFLDSQLTCADGNHGALILGWSFHHEACYHLSPWEILGDGCW